MANDKDAKSTPADEFVNNITKAAKGASVPLYVAKEGIQKVSQDIGEHLQAATLAVSPAMTAIKALGVSEAVTVPGVANVIDNLTTPKHVVAKAGPIKEK